MVTQLLFRIVEQHQGVYEQNSNEKIARFCETEPTKDVKKGIFCLFRLNVSTILLHFVNKEKIPFLTFSAFKNLIAGTMILY
jgi:hypothetical protein